MEPPLLRPMLASSGPIQGSEDDWAFEPKFDGWRVMVTVGHGLVVRTRTGRDVTQSVPELSGLPAAVDHRAVVLDGELVAQLGTPESFYRVGPRMSAGRAPASTRRGSATSLSFVAFDCLWMDGVDLCGAPYQDRRLALEALGVAGPAWCTAPSFPGAGAELFAACVEHRLEGLVAKRLDSRYRCGERSPHWIKAKTPEWRAVHAGWRHKR